MSNDLLNGALQILAQERRAMRVGEIVEKMELQKCDLDLFASLSKYVLLPNSAVRKRGGPTRWVLEEDLDCFNLSPVTDPILKAAIQVLRAEVDPMTASEITEKILAQKLCDLPSLKPEVFVSASLTKFYDEHRNLIQRIRATLWYHVQRDASPTRK